jgi:uncharacterized coiled-coil protein SlyX
MTETLAARLRAKRPDFYVTHSEAVEPSFTSNAGVFLTTQERDEAADALDAAEATVARLTADFDRRGYAIENLTKALGQQQRATEKAEATVARLTAERDEARVIGQRSYDSLMSEAIEWRERATAAETARDKAIALLPTWLRQAMEIEAKALARPHRDDGGNMTRLISEVTVPQDLLNRLRSNRRGGIAEEAAIEIERLLVELGRMTERLWEAERIIANLREQLGPPPMVNGRMNSWWR